MSLITFTARGMYCAAADVYIDPWRPVERAIVTHAHSDHARWGMQSYWCHEQSVPLLRQRLGADIVVEGSPYGEQRTINGVTFSLHPAGHMVGSAQVRVEYHGEVWVASGDYKTMADGTCPPFEPVRCNTFITECTFGLPVYQWAAEDEIFREIHAWWKANQAEGVCSVLAGYSMGKAQHLLAHLDPAQGPLLTHGAVANANEAMAAAGLVLPPSQHISEDTDKKLFRTAMVIAPPSALGTPWLRKLGAVSTGFASGWMRLRGARRRSAVDRGFALSDHADWPGLNAAVDATGAERVIATHGYTDHFSQWLRERGLDAHAEKTLFKGEELQETEPAAETPEATP